MTSKNKINVIAGILLTELNKTLENIAHSGNENLCNVIEATVIDRLDNGSETKLVAEEIMRIMFPGIKNLGQVSVGYNKQTFAIKAIIDIKIK